MKILIALGVTFLPFVGHADSYTSPTTSQPEITASTQEDPPIVSDGSGWICNGESLCCSFQGSHECLTDFTCHGVGGACQIHD